MQWRTALGLASRQLARPLERLGPLGARIAAVFFPSAIPDVSVYRFDSVSDIRQFEIATDRAIGGLTVCSFGVKSTRDGIVGVFEGVMRNEDPLFRADDGRRAVYASFRTKVQCPMPDLSPFAGLQLTVKTDGRPYLVVLSSKSESYESALDDAQALNTVETWQCELAVPGGRWVTVTAPFDSFVRVDRGHVTVQQRSNATDGESGMFTGPNPGALQSLAVVLSDGLPGEFRMCVAEIRAVRHFRPEHHSLALPAGTNRLRRRSRSLTGNTQPGAAAGRVEAPPKRIGHETEADERR